MAEQMINVKIQNIKEVKQVPCKTTLKELFNMIADSFDKTVTVASVDNNMHSLDYVLSDDCSVEFYDTTTKFGLNVYAESAVFILGMAVAEVFPEAKLNVLHAIGEALYCKLGFKGGRKLLVEDLKVIEDKMLELTQKDLPIKRIFMSREKLIDHFAKKGCYERTNLLRYGLRNTVGVYECNGYLDYISGTLVSSTGIINNITLVEHKEGFFMQKKDFKSDDLIESKKSIFGIYRECSEWQDILNVYNVGDLNDRIVKKDSSKLICVAEAFQEKKIAMIADKIAANKEKLRVVLIAGPSSSGKTTFAQRLQIQMLINGLKPVSLSLDDYFVNREDTPLDEFGELDFEALDAIDLPLFNEQLRALIEGKEVDLPTFNFNTGQREYKGNRLRIQKDQPLIIEGIHALNPRLTESIPAENKFKIYISALTQVNLDPHNRIPTTDARLIRRIVRDSQFRSKSALDTLNLWASVRRGEEKNIFPYQKEADIMFNSALIYELAVLKKYAEPLLLEISSSESKYSEARRLLKFLSYILTIPDNDVPATSIIREFIGNSFFSE